MSTKYQVFEKCPTGRKIHNCKTRKQAKAVTDRLKAAGTYGGIWDTTRNPITEAMGF